MGSACRARGAAAAKRARVTAAWEGLAPQIDNIETWIGKLMPSRQFGFIVLTSSAGIVDHEEARRKHVGGKLLGFFY